MAELETEKPTKPSGATTAQNALTAGLFALLTSLPNKVIATGLGVLSPFISEGIMWLVRNQANEWLAERKATAPTRRAERYLKQMQREYRKMKPENPERAPLLAKITEVSNRIHAHKIAQLELQPIAAAEAKP